MARVFSDALPSFLAPRYARSDAVRNVRRKIWELPPGVAFFLLALCGLALCGLALGEVSLPWVSLQVHDNTRSSIQHLVLEYTSVAARAHSMSQKLKEKVVCAREN